MVIIKTKYLVVSPGYPSEDNKYNNAFVHSRVKKYQESGIAVDVFSYSKKSSHYNYENVDVIEGNKDNLINMLKRNKYHKILIHFGFWYIVKPIIKTVPNIPLIIWVHGTEGLGWYRRFFAFNLKKPYRFLGYILINTRQMIFVHNFIRNKNIDKTFVFVSNWMKNIYEKDSLSKNKIDKYQIIPNVIDKDNYKYLEKKENDRLNILSIRTYQSKKYANDLSVKAILELSKEPFFKNLKFTFYGDGRLFDETLKPIKNMKNVTIYRKFLNAKEISEAHAKNGLMLIPTRQDAQGVSMCEAMSSGLVPITSNNTAIPEYVNSSCGYLTNNYHEIALAIKTLYNNPKLFVKMSKKASEFIQKKCAPKIVIQKEVDLITK